MSPIASLPSSGGIPTEATRNPHQSSLQDVSPNVLKPYPTTNGHRNVSKMVTSLNADPSSEPPPSSTSRIVDDKSPYCIPFILSRLRLHRALRPSKPFFIGLNGVQGAGKTTLVSALAKTLQEEGLETLVCSIDDLYLPYKEQVALAKEHSLNPLVQHRGEPGRSFSLASYR